MLATWYTMVYLYHLLVLFKYILKPGVFDPCTTMYYRQLGDLDDRRHERRLCKSGTAGDGNISWHVMAIYFCLHINLRIEYVICILILYKQSGMYICMYILGSRATALLA